MTPDKFNDLADKFDTFYVTYKKTRAVGKTYLVGTHNLETPYIQKHLKSAPENVKKLVNTPEADKVVLFSYTNDRFRVLEYSQVVWMRMMSTEISENSSGRR
jgi:hypothetical protein